MVAVHMLVDHSLSCMQNAQACTHAGPRAQQADHQTQALKAGTHSMCSDGRKLALHDESHLGGVGVGAARKWRHLQR